MTKRTRFISAIVIAGLLSGSAIVQGQIICTIPCPVWNPANIAQHGIIAAVTELMNAVLYKQAVRTYIMARRLSTWVPLTRYVIDPLLQPDWRLHDIWWPLYALEYNWVLTYGGDADGERGFRSVTIPRRTAGGVLASFGPEGEASLRADLATLDALDSALIVNTNTAGTLRLNGRSFGQANNDMQEIVLDEDMEQSANAVLGKLTGGALVEARSKQTRIQLLGALVELDVVDSKSARDADARSMNAILAQLEASQDDEGRPPSLADGAGEAIRNWRLP